jgi:NAD+ dependent glucose-6-phosphate dehydrogenase
LKKKITIIGGAGTIGSILYKGLSDKYTIVILDKTTPKYANEFIKVDATNPASLLDSIPKDSDVLINLLTIKTENDLRDVQEFQRMTNVHLQSSFYVYHAAISLGIPKVVYASSNHTTDSYENDGFSTLGREITTSDFPYSRGLYGVLKFASEQVGYLMTKQSEKLSIINLRIGSVHPDEQKAVKEDNRLHRTLLSHEDTVQLFDLAIQSTVKYGTYYGVSDNPDKPWSVESTYRELGYIPRVNSLQVKKGLNDC